MQVIFIQGMTASGKSAIALEIAEKLKGCIVNCDSIQCYDKVSIGAAMPTDEDFKKVPHYLYKFVKPMNEITAGQYAKAFFSEITKIEQAGFPYAIVVGGTGFYFQAIEKGMYDTKASDFALRKQLEDEASEKGYEVLYQEMIKLDPALKEKIHLNDHYRILRSLEVLRVSEKTLTEMNREHSTKIAEKQIQFPYPLLKFAIDIPREELLVRIEKRTDKMLTDGLIEEVETLVKNGLKDWAPLKSVGYAECLAYLEREIETVAELRESIIVSTRQLAKKQKTWFKRDNELNWVSPDTAAMQVLKMV